MYKHMDTKARLKKCFLTVFPQLDENTVLSASEDTVEEWNSIKLISLVLAIEEEFSKTIPDSRIAEITSFSNTMKLVESL